MEAVIEVNNNTSEKVVLEQEVTVREHEETVTDCSPHSLEVTGPEQWLCVAKLPLDLTEDEFYDLLVEFGGVRESFLMVSAKSGVCKGYGFARFSSSVAGLQARHVLEGQEVRGHRVDCGWLKEGTHKLESLNSKVLYVDQLPPGFRDLAQFRRMFSTVVTPPYCQIAQKNGVLQSWGLVEYNTAQEAEDTKEALLGAKLDEVPVRLQYCIPNTHAINIYMSFVNNPLERGVEQKALMDETPSKDVYHQLQALSRQNPCFVQSLKSIMSQSSLDSGLGPQMSQQDPATPPEPPQHAVLALLLATQLQAGGQTGGLANLTSLIKQLEGGTSAMDLLRSALSPPVEARQAPLLPNPPGDPKPTLLPSPGGQQDLSSLISNMTAMVGGCSNTPSVPVPTQQGNPNTKNPQLMNMLYSSFQARQSKQATQQDQTNTSSASDLGPTDPNECPTMISPNSNPLPQTSLYPTPAHPASLPSGYSACLTTGYPAPPVYTTTTLPSHYSAHNIPPPSIPTSHGQTPHNLNTILSLPPPPPPPGHPYPTLQGDPAAALAQQAWQFSPQGQALLFPHMQLNPGLWPHQPNLFMTPNPLAPQTKRKVPGVSDCYTERPDNQGFKRQKLCGSS